MLGRRNKVIITVTNEIDLHIDNNKVTTQGHHTVAHSQHVHR